MKNFLPLTVMPGAVQEEFFTTEYCCPTDSLEKKVIFVSKLRGKNSS